MQNAKGIKSKNSRRNFKHETEPIADTKEVTETIHYLYEDNSQAANDVKHSVTFTKTGTKDLVTGKENSKWSAVQTFPEVISPVIPGYTPTQSKIAPISVDHTSNDIDKTVIYTANKQQATLRFYDDSSKKFIDFASILYFTNPDNFTVLPELFLTANVYFPLSSISIVSSLLPFVTLI